jgi:hypothetical protein
MDQQTKDAILSDAIERAYREVEAATGAEMDTPEFGTLLRNLGDMEWMLNRYHLEPDVPPMQRSEPDAPKSEKLAEPEPETPKPESETTTSTTENAMSKEELREQVAALANKYPSLDAFSLMQEMGFSKLSDIPAGRRAEYLEKVKAAVEVA